MIQARNLRKKFGQLVAVEDVSFEIPPGQICGYLGPNGAGKSTTVNMLVGMVPPTNGTARICGHDICIEPLTAKGLMGLVPEAGAVYESLTPMEYLRFVARLYGMPEDRTGAKISRFLELFGLGEHANDRMTSFSKGMKQRAVILAALIHDPQVIILDEPLNGLDANAALLLKGLLRMLADKGRTILYCSHILDVVEKVCDRVIIIDRGRLVADDSTAVLKSLATSGTLEGVFSQLTNTEDTEAKAGQLLAAIREPS